MRAKEFIPASKPRNFVAKNQKTAGAGAHKDKKKAEKQGYEKHKGKDISEDIDLKFYSLELHESQIQSYVKKYFESYNIEQPHIKSVSNIKRFVNKKLSESDENKKIESFIKMINRLDSTKKIKIGDMFSVLSFEIIFAWKEINAFGFTKPKEVEDIKLHANGSINYIKFTDGDRYPRLTPATYSGKPIIQTAYFNDQKLANQAMTALMLKVPSEWSIDVDNVKGIKKQDISEGISVVKSDYDLDQMVLTLDIEGQKKQFTYWDYDEDFDNAERRDVFDQLQKESWFKGLDHPTKMEILDASYKAIRGEEPSEYKPTVGDEPLDLDEGWGSDDVTSYRSGYTLWTRTQSAGAGEPRYWLYRTPKHMVGQDDRDIARAIRSQKPVGKYGSAEEAFLAMKSGVAEAIRQTDDPFDDMIEDYLDYLESVGQIRKSREEEKTQLISDLKAGYVHPSDIEYALSGTQWDPLGEQGVAEADKHSMLGKIQRHQELKKKVDTSFADIGKAQKQGDHTAASKAFRKHERYANLERPGTWTKVKEQGVAEGSEDLVQIEYWQQETIESGRWIKTKPMPRATAEKIVNSFERGEIVDVEQGVAEGSVEELDAKYKAQSANWKDVQKQYGVEYLKTTRSGLADYKTDHLSPEDLKVVQNAYQQVKDAWIELSRAKNPHNPRADADAKGYGKSRYTGD